MQHVHLHVRKEFCSTLCRRRSIRDIIKLSWRIIKLNFGGDNTARWTGADVRVSSLRDQARTSCSTCVRLQLVCQRSIWRAFAALSYCLGYVIRMTLTTAALIAFCVLCAPQTGAQQAPAPSPAAITASANVSGSLGYYCSNAAGLQALVQSASQNQAPSALNVTIPAAVQDSTNLANIASVRCLPTRTFNFRIGCVLAPSW